MIDYQRLESGIDELRARFQAALPWPHLVLDGVLDDDLLATAVESWPNDSAPWKGNQRGKRGLSDLAAMPDGLARIATELNLGRFVSWLAALTGIHDLTPDRALGGAGLHEVAAGGSLQMHVDFNRLGDLYRRLNVLLYVNRDWQSAWGGDLELMDHPEKPTEHVCIAPLWNRLVISESSDRSWHGHPHPLRCPLDRSRRSIAAYYYSREPHPSYKKPHSTKYVIDKDRLRKENREWAKANGIDAE